VSPRAAERLKARSAPNRSWYFDLKLLMDYYLESHRYHHTAPISMFYALHEGLTLIEEEGLDNRLARHRDAHEEFIRRAEGMGLTMLVAAGHRIWNLVTPRVPQGVDDAKVRAALLKDHGIEIAGGFGPLAGKVFRIGLMGPLATRETVHEFLDCFQAALRVGGHKG
jgi:alanine-glyoxylate transaminase/serine-glyoxylate transaminase/serine-pyruvate transaminase